MHSVCRRVFAWAAAIMFAITAMYVVATDAASWTGTLPAPGSIDPAPMIALSGHGADPSGHMEVALGAVMTSISPATESRPFYDVYVQTHISANSLLQLGYDVSYGSHGLVPSPVPETLTEFTLRNDACREVVFPIYRDIPFTFSYYGKIYDRVWVHENGFLVFGNEPNEPYKTPQNMYPDWGTTTPNSVLAPLWSDLDGKDGLIVCGITDPGGFGDPPKYSIVWQGFKNMGGRPQTFGVTLHGGDFGGVFEFKYQDVKNPDYYTVKTKGKKTNPPTVAPVPISVGFEDQLAKWGCKIDAANTDTTNGRKNVTMTPSDDNGYSLRHVYLYAYDKDYNGNDDTKARVLISGADGDLNIRGINILESDISYAPGTNPWIEAAWSTGFAALALFAVGTPFAAIITVSGLVVNMILLSDDYRSYTVSGVNSRDSAYVDGDPAWVYAHSQDWAQRAINPQWPNMIYETKDMYLAPLLQWRISSTDPDPRLSTHTLQLVAVLEGWDCDGNVIQASAEVEYTFNPWTVSSAPQSVSATPGADNIVVSWTPPAYPGGGVENYLVYRKTVTTSYSLVATLDGSTLSYVDTAVSIGQKYSYRIYASNVAGTGPGSNEVSAGIGNTPPTAHILTISPNPAVLGQTISFSGYGIDPDPGGSIVGYRWRSDLDGVLSYDASFSWSGLSLGTHTIYFWVVDCYSAASAEVTHSVTVNAPSGNFVLTVTTNGPPGCTTPSEGTYVYSSGSVVQLTALPFLQDQQYTYDFRYWLVDGVSQGLDVRTISVTMYSDHTAHAVYLKRPIL